MNKKKLTIGLKTVSLSICLLFSTSNTQLSAQIAQSAQTDENPRIDELEKQISYFSKEIRSMKNKLAEISKNQEGLVEANNQYIEDQKRQITTFKAIEQNQLKLVELQESLNNEMIQLKSSHLSVENDLNIMLGRSKMILFYTILFLILGFVIIWSVVNRQSRKQKLNWFSLMRDALNS